MTSHEPATIGRGTFRTKILLTVLISLIVIAGTGYGSDIDPATPGVSTDGTRSIEYQKPPSLSSVSFQMGTCALAGELYEGRGSGVTYQMSARMQVLRRLYLGMLYMRQSLDGEIVHWPLYPQGPSRYVNVDFHQHELYILAGFRLGQREFSGRCYNIEAGLGTAFYGDLVYESEGTTDRVRGRSELAIWLAGSVVQPISRRIGVSFEVNSRFVGDGFNRDTRRGALIGVSLGLVFVTAE